MPYFLDEGIGIGSWPGLCFYQNWALLDGSFLQMQRNQMQRNGPSARGPDALLKNVRNR